MVDRHSQPPGTAPDAPDPLSGHGASWDELKLFLAVAVHGSMNRAAVMLGQSQPTISRRLKALERALGVALVERSANSVVLTPAGKMVLEAAKPMAEGAAAAHQAAAQARPDPGAPIRITATTSVSMFLGNHIQELADAARPLEVVFVVTRRRLDLAAGEADIALRMRNPGDNPDVVARRIGSIGFSIYGVSDNPALPVIPPYEDPALSSQAAMIAHFAQGRTVAARLGDLSVRGEAIRAGRGVGMMPCWMGDSNRSLLRLNAPDRDFCEDVFLLTHPFGRRRAEVVRVAEAISRLFRRQRRQLAGEVDDRLSVR
jgi:DNA-binding transcriptional LysR family regulator